LLAPAGDPTALAACLRQVLSDSSLRQRLASAGQERARAAFSERQMIDEIDAIYETLLRRRDAPSHG
jgi:glycosyltransferase involved in cell wall biosynthesis